MHDHSEWDSFYVIVGSAAGALIGLQFVVMTLIAERPPLRAAEAGATCATPTIVHFGAALLLSALLRAPSPTVTLATTLCGIIGFGGAVYALITAKRLASKPFIDQSLRTGCSTSYCLWQRTSYSRYRLSRLYLTRASLYLRSQVQRCCRSSSAFTTPGMPLPTTSL